MIIAPITHLLLPAIDGLHIADGRVYPIALDDHGYTRAASIPVEAAERDAPVATLFIDHEFADDDDALLLCAGSGGWEGEGFLALIHRHSREALWVLYAEQAEAFVSAKRERGVVYALSEDYPFAFQWRIRDTSPPEIAGLRVRMK